MNNFSFTKSFVKSNGTTTNSNYNKATELDRINRIHDNMAGINPYTKKMHGEVNTVQDLQKKEVQTNDLQARMNALRGVKKD